MQILFRKEGCAINGFSIDFNKSNNEYLKDQLTNGLPEIFKPFIFEEPVKTIGTTFCIWSDNHEKWKIGQIGKDEDGSVNMLFIFDEKPSTYID